MSSRETTTTGRTFATMPKSASQTSPGLVFCIDEVQHFLFHLARPQGIKRIYISEIHNL